jgi:hypothetical protein
LAPQENGSNRNDRYDSSKAFTEMRQKKEEEAEEEEEYDISPSTQTLNWADEEYEDDPAPTPSNGPPPRQEEPVFDLRDKLKAMRLAAGQVPMLQNFLRL